MTRQNDRRPLKVALLAMAVTAGLYLGGAAAFVLMLWTLFQLAMFFFGG